LTEKAQVQEETKATEEKPQETKWLDPSKAISNYLVQFVSEDGKTVIKTVLANRCTINVVDLGKQSLAAEIR